MVEAGILPGDIVVVHKQPTANNGDIVVAQVDDEATVKKLRILKTQAQLVPANPQFKKIVVDLKALTILGRVIQVRRDLD